MIDPERSRLVSRRWRWGRAGTCLLCLVLAVLGLGGCRRGLCPATTYPADIYVQLAPEWPGAESLSLTVGCPASAECGFLDGPVTTAALPYNLVTTVLRPAEVDVLVLETATGNEVARQLLPVQYRPAGRQDECGRGQAVAEVAVPYDPAGSSPDHPGEAAGEQS